MKIIIVGAGEIGTHLALFLSQKNHTIVVIDSEESVASELESKIDARVLVGDGTSPNVQLEADVPGCDVFFALTSENNINLVASTVAKKFEAKRTVCRLHQSLEAQFLLYDLGDVFGADEFFSSERLAAVDLSKYIRNPHPDGDRVVEEIAGGFIELMELKVPAGSKVIGKSLRELEFPKRSRVCVIKRFKQILIPTASEELRKGDVLTIAGPQSAVAEIVKWVEPKKQFSQGKNVVIFGGGDYGVALAQTLSASGGDYRIRIFESNLELCETLADKLSNVTILNADATSLAELQEENVGDADFFVAATTRDEDNVMTCLQAHSLGATHCLTLFHRADYADAITKFKGQMGILAAVSPREATRNMLMRFVADSFHLLRKLDGAELIEISVAENSPAEGKRVRDVAWPEGCILVGLWHSSDVKVPSADDQIEGGDNIYALVTDQAKKGFVKLVSSS